MNEVLVRALAGLITSMELTNDELLPREVAATLTEEVVAELGELPQAEKCRLIGILDGLAGGESDPDRRAVMSELPELLGLLDGE